jgi:hypothetical protein
MSKLIKFILGILIIVYRCGLIYCVSVGLYNTYKDQNNTFNNLQWYICAIIFDMYLMNLEKHLSVDIYIKKENGQKTDTGD